MTLHHEKRIVPYTPSQLFDLVADVKKYPEFLPWCVGARIRSKEERLVIADLMIGYKLVRERFTSKVILDRKNKVIVESKIKYIRIINIEKKGPCLKKDSINTKPAMYPDGIDPESPKNIFAGGLLCL